MSAAGAPGTRRAATLVVTNPSGSRSRVQIQPLPFNIGRQVENHLVLRDNRASRNHARITTEAGEYYIEDLNSSHGVFVNGKRKRKQKLYAADRIEFGFPDSYSLIFTFDDDEIHRILDQFTASRAAASSGAGNLAKLRALVEVARALQNSLSTEDVLTAVVDAALAITGFERGYLLLNANGVLEVSVARDRYAGPLRKDTFEVPIDRLYEALLHRRELLSMTFDPESAELSNQTLHGEDLRSVVCIPLVRVRAGSTQETCMITSRSDTVGVIYLDSRQTAVDLSSGNRELLQTLALEGSTVLENARLLEEERIKQRMEEELSIAREIQASLLPRTLPDHGWFRASGSSIPSHEVGGDCFDVRQATPDSWTAVVTDVSGKGVSSALLAALLQGSFLTGSAVPGGVEALMSRINQFLYERTQGEKYATVFYCIVFRDGTLHWANAGHVKPMLVRASGEIRDLDTTGMPLGMLDVAEFGSDTLRIEPGDKIFAFSDGLTEAQNGAGAFYGERRLKTLVKEGASASAAALHGIIVDDIQR
ncbi:MAG TPA: SpoIIE family protein phosphatase, partial [Bryobacteraceae bacterium]|nr:SpoIIE family protein phosphatase [Bryobacteraceae bacterium]